MKTFLEFNATVNQLNWISKSVVVYGKSLGISVLFVAGVRAFGWVMYLSKIF